MTVKLYCLKNIITLKGQPKILTYNKYSRLYKMNSKTGTNKPNLYNQVLYVELDDLQAINLVSLLQFKVKI